MDTKRESRIKRANTDWWINEKSIVGNNGMTYIAYMTDMGEIHIKEFDAKCSRNISRDFCLCRLNCNYADEHNAPSMCILENGKIIVMYTGHAAAPVLRYRITEKPYDIYSFGPEHKLEYDGDITYVQIFENTLKNELWLFTRVNSVTWQFRYSRDDGESFSEPRVFLESDAGGLFYLDVRKQYVPGKYSTEEQWLFALYGHPRLSKDHTIRSGIFTSEGELINPDGTTLKLNLYNKEEKMNLSDLSVVYSSPENMTVRLCAVAPTLPLRVGFVSFGIGNAESAVYYSATYQNTKWCLSEPIVKAGSFLAPEQTDGSETYIPGMAYYYGVGEAGFNPADGGITYTNKIFIAHADKDSWFLDSYVTHNGGKTYEKFETIRKIPVSENIKIWRPIVPIHAQDNLPVYWHEGTYSAHTGGWHCDVVMDVEYDD